MRVIVFRYWTKIIFLSFIFNEAWKILKSSKLTHSLRKWFRIPIQFRPSSHTGYFSWITVGKRSNVKKLSQNNFFPNLLPQFFYLIFQEQIRNTIIKSVSNIHNFSDSLVAVWCKIYHLTHFTTIILSSLSIAND